MIFEALSSTGNVNGLDVNTIRSYIEQRYDQVPQNIRKFLSTKLRRLVMQGKLEKIGNCYRIKEAVPNNHENCNDRQNAQQNTETLEDAASYAAYKVAVAEKLSKDAEEACKEVERLEKIAEESMAMLKLAEELHRKCSDSADGIVLLD